MTVTGQSDAPVCLTWRG